MANNLRMPPSVASKGISKSISMRLDLTKMDEQYFH